MSISDRCKQFKWFVIYRVSSIVSYDKLESLSPKYGTVVYAQSCVWIHLPLNYTTLDKRYFLLKYNMVSMQMLFCQMPLYGFDALSEIAKNEDNRIALGPHIGVIVSLLQEHSSDRDVSGAVCRTSMCLYYCMVIIDVESLWNILIE